MATTYTTRQGETVDLACLRHYGRTAEVTELVLDANRGIATAVVLPMGTVLTMPDYDTKTADTTLVSLWE
jgi:phage tail protein X